MDNDTAYLESLYNNRAAVPDFQSYFDRWAEKSAEARRLLNCEIDVPYGDDIMETMDVFLPKGESRAILMFIHGGYWRSLDKKDHSFVAVPFVNAGVTVAAINYSLCPNVTIEHIVKQTIAAGSFLYKNAADFEAPRKRMFVAGHSAGGHLTAMALACLWKLAAPGLPQKVFQGGLSVSGLYDLRPLTKVPFLNVDLRLTEESAVKLSPALMTPPTNAPLYISVGGQEIGGFKDQHRIIAQSWRKVIGADIPCPSDHHFSILDRLADPQSELFKAALRMMDLE
ncbi:MAG TPA: alpha/beta hydrolase [Burkholderiales bacterium]|nr:alpha/beta hydrolase [Burkholderiales bacterium]